MKSLKHNWDVPRHFTSDYLQTIGSINKTPQLQHAVTHTSFNTDFSSYETMKLEAESVFSLDDLNSLYKPCTAFGQAFKTETSMD